MFGFYKECKLKVTELKTILPNPLVLYEGDLVTIKFTLVKKLFHKDIEPLISDDYSNCFADFTIIKPDGTQLDISNVAIDNSAIIFKVNEAITSEDSIGKNKMQIRIGNTDNNSDSSIFAIPDFTFEVRPRLGNHIKTTTYNYLVDENGVAYADETGTYILCFEN